MRGGERITLIIDKNLKITNYKTNFRCLNETELKGKKYFEVIPKIYVDKKDAVLSIFKDSKKLCFKDITFNCFFDNTKADIFLEPISRGRTEFVKMTIRNFRPCSFIEQYNTSKKFIDIGKVASSLAHGVRNPLNAIKGAIIYIYEKYKDDQSLMEFLKIMNEEISRLDNFISRFLSTSLSNTEVVPLDINRLLKKIELYISFQTHSQNIRTIYEYRPIPILKLNPFQIEQAILNIVNNAIEAMTGGGELCIKTYIMHELNDDYAVIEVSDTGMGMISKKMPCNSNGTGRGYGLFITREIIKYYGGYIEIKSSKGTGSTVRLYLPIKNLKSGQ